MDDELRTNVNIDVLVDLGLFRCVNCFYSVFLPFLITSLFIPSDQIGNHLGKYWNESIKNHSLRNSVANRPIPQRNKIIEGSIKNPPDPWGHFTKISIDKQK
jgi:hypothetical protein